MRGHPAPASPAIGLSVLLNPQRSGVRRALTAYLAYGVISERNFIESKPSSGGSLRLTDRPGQRPHPCERGTTVHSRPRSIGWSRVDDRLEFGVKIASRNPASRGDGVKSVLPHVPSRVARAC